MNEKDEFLISIKEQTQSDLYIVLETIVEELKRRSIESDLSKLNDETKANKYVNPDNHFESWTGKGRKPGWLLNKLATGATLEDFENRE